MSDFCVVCSPRSGSYYLINALCQSFDLVNGNEWFGRNKKADLTKSSELSTTAVDIDWTVNEDLLSAKEIQQRLNHLKNFPVPFCIKAMPLQFTNTIKQVNLPRQERLEFAVDILNQFNLIWFKRRDKISHFCFELTAMFCSQPDYPRNREYSNYKSEKRTTPKPQSFTATEKDFERYMFREKFTETLYAFYFPMKAPVIEYEDFLEDSDKSIMEIANWYNLKPNFLGQDKKEIIQNPDYSEIFTNYKEITEWFQLRK